MSSYLRIGMNEPLNALLYLIRGKDFLIKKKTAEALGVSVKEVTQIYDEIIHSKFLPDEYKIENIGQIASPEVLYVICRLLRPRVVVETGVASGLSSAYLLKALDDNGDGKLISIDMPNYEDVLIKEKPEYLSTPQAVIPQGKETGWAVPLHLRKRWNLKLGLVQDLLLPVLNEAGSIDIFLHDSEHTYENMMFEFRNSWRHLSEGGCLLSHDITWNSSFMDFAKEVRRTYTPIYFTGMGCIRK